MKNKARNFEFLTLFVMVVGTVIGSGIFMKNSQLLTETGNPIIAIILWVVVGAIAVMTVYVFVEIASSTRHFGNGTISNWTKIFINRRLASFFSMFYLTLYFPICQAVFTAGFITYFFLALGINLPVSTQLTVYLVAGISFIVIFSLINGLSPVLGKRIQIFGTFFKFIPLIIALVAGFFLIDKTGGSSAIWNGSGIGSGEEHPWSSSDFRPDLFIRGFGAILFAFDGFIYIANSQKTAKHKEVVPKALLVGMIFVALFYTLMAISLFLGSPDGSIVKVLEKVFSGNNPNNQTAIKAAEIISDIFLMIICLIGINLFTYLGMVDLESSADAKLVYSKNRGFSYRKAAWVQLSFSIAIYVGFILFGALITRDTGMDNLPTWKGINTIKPDDMKIGTWLGITTDKISSFIGTVSSTASTLAFMMIASILVASIVNRRTQKVKVEKIKGFLPIAIICAILLYILVIAGVFSFVMPLNVLNGKVTWIKSDGFYFLILLIAGLSVATIGYLLQEYWLFKKDPFKKGFDGYLALEKIKQPVNQQTK